MRPRYRSGRHSCRLVRAPVPAALHRRPPHGSSPSTLDARVPAIQRPSTRSHVTVDNSLITARIEYSHSSIHLSQLGPATREQAPCRHSSVTNHREQRQFLVHFRQLSGPELTTWEASSSGRIRRWGRWLHFTASLRSSSDGAGRLNVMGSLARAFGMAPGALSARNCVPRPMTSTRVVLLRRRRAP